MSFRQRRDLVKEENTAAQKGSIGKSLQSVDNLIKSVQSRQKDDKPKTNKQLAD